MSTTVYRSTHPTVLAAVDQHKAELADYDARLKTFIAEHLPEGTRTIINGGGFGGYRLLGFAVPDGTAVPAGWRVKGNTVEYIVPRLNTKIGKAAQAGMDPLEKVPNLIGALPMQGLIFLGSGWFSPAVKVADDGTVWVRWGLDVEAAADADEQARADARGRGEIRGRNVERPDPALWERVPLSAYYGLVEAGNDPFAKAA